MIDKVAMSYTTAQIEVKKKDLLVLYTDGLIEAENSAGFQFSYERFKEFFQANKHLDVDVLKEKLVTFTFELIENKGTAFCPLRLMSAKILPL